jgi:hypothetical protein
MKKFLMLGLAVILTSTTLGQSQAIDEKSFEYERYGGKEYCLKSDFDGNGTSDYIAPLGEGWIKVFMKIGSDSERTIDIDAGGVAELYELRDEVGENGEPIVENPSILVRWVGQVQVVFTWMVKNLKKYRFQVFMKSANNDMQRTRVMNNMTCAADAER